MVARVDIRLTLSSRLMCWCISKSVSSLGVVYKALLLNVLRRRVVCVYSRETTDVLCRFLQEDLEVVWLMYPCGFASASFVMT